MQTVRAVTESSVRQASLSPAAIRRGARQKGPDLAMARSRAEVRHGNRSGSARSVARRHGTGRSSGRIQARGGEAGFGKTDSEASAFSRLPCTGKVRHVLQGHTDAVEFVAFSPNGQRLATGSSDKHVRLWDVESGESIAVLQGHQNRVFDLTFLDPNRLVSASMDRTLRLWDTASGVTLRVFQGHQEGVVGVAVKDEHLYSASNDGTVRRWSLQLQSAFTVIDLPEGPRSAAIAPHGSQVAVGFADGGLRLYALPDGRLLWGKAGAHSDNVKRLTFSPDGQQLASASFDKTVKLWQTSDGQLVQTFSGHRDSVHAVAFSPDGQSLATASYDGQLGLFRIGEEQGRFYKAHDGHVNSVTFDPSGKRLVSTGDDGAVRLWDLRA